MPELETIHDVIRRFADGDKKLALTFFTRAGQERHTYQQLARDVAALAGGLQAKGMGAGTRVAVLSANSYAWIITALAVIRGEGILVPIDVQLEDETLQHIIADSGARWVFASGDQVPRLKERLSTDTELVAFDAYGEETWQALLESGFRPISAPGNPDGDAILFYTSGTTGRPKGVPLTHRNICFQLETIRRQNLLQAQERIFLPLPLHHVYPLVIGLLTPLSLGLQIVFPQALTGPQMIRSLKEARVTVMIGVPRLYRSLVEGIESRVASRGAGATVVFRLCYGFNAVMVRCGLSPGKACLAWLHENIGPDLRLLASGGSALSAALHSRLRIFGWQVAIGYGLTETAPLLSIQHQRDYRPGSAGKPVEGVDLRIHKEDPQRPDEVFALGPNVFRGYWHMQEETQKVFANDGWFRTGDMGEFRDGFLYLTGRVSTMIVTESGKNIQPDKVEEVLTRAPLIREAGILQDENRLLAVVVVDHEALCPAGGNGSESVRRVVQQLIQKLPSYQRPHDFVVTSESLPRTRLGKVRRHLLPGIFHRIRSEGTSVDQGTARPISISEMSDADQHLLDAPDVRRLWEWLAAQYPDTRLTPDASPQLDLGIDSMGWINISLEIRELMGKELSDQAIARVETVRDLLTAVAEQESLSEEGESIFSDPESKISEDQKKWLRPHNLLQRWLSRVLHLLIRLLARFLFRVRAEGLDRLPAERPFILTPNHVSYLDPFVLGAVLSFEQLQQTYWAGWTGVAFNNVFTRTFSRLARVVPIDPHKGAVSSLAFVAAALKRRQNVVIFPEGQRSPTGEMIPFKPGLGVILGHFDLAVVPVMIVGTYEAWPSHRRFFRPHPVRVVFGEPVPGWALRGHAANTGSPEALMQALSERFQSLKEDARAATRPPSKGMGTGSAG